MAAAESAVHMQLHVEGWDNYGPLRLKPQTRHDEQEEQEFWNVIQLAGHDLQPDLREQVQHELQGVIAPLQESIV